MNINKNNVWETLEFFSNKISKKKIDEKDQKNLFIYKNFPQIFFTIFLNL